MYEEIEKMYLLYDRELRLFLLKLGADQDLADDIVQTTFLEALKSIERYNEKSSLKTWLFSIAKNQLYNYFRKNKINIDMETISVAETADFTNKIMAEHILQFVQQLSPPINELMKLRLLYGLSFKEIGVKIGRTENYCRVNFYRVKMQIRKEFDDEEL